MFSDQRSNSIIVVSETEKKSRSMNCFLWGLLNVVVVVVVKLQSHVQHLTASWTVSHQAPLFVGLVPEMIESRSMNCILEHFQVWS